VTRGEFAEAVYSYCVLLTAYETGGYRPVQRNTEKHGVAHSAHLVKLASDVQYLQPVPLVSREAWARRLGLKLVVEDTHDHLEPLTWEKD